MIVFWLAIIAGLIGAFFGIKKRSFYAIWAILFNLMISIYVSVMVARPIISLLERSAAGYGYHLAISILLTTAVIFALLQIIAVSFFTSYDLQFPKICDTAGSAVLGFIIAFLTCSYIFCIICIMPVSKTNFMSWLNGPQGPPNSTAVVSVSTTCDIIAKVSLQRYDEYKDARSLLMEIINSDSQPDEQPTRQPIPDNTEEENIPLEMLFPD